VRYRPATCGQHQQPIIACVVSCDGQIYAVNPPPPPPPPPQQQQQQPYTVIPAIHTVSLLPTFHSTCSANVDAKLFWIIFLMFVCTTLASCTTFYRVAQKFTLLNRLQRIQCHVCAVLVCWYTKIGQFQFLGRISRTQYVDADNCVNRSRCRLAFTVKNIRISTYILWRVFHILTEPVPYTFVSINRLNNEAGASLF